MSKYNIFHRCSFKHQTEKSFRKRGRAPTNKGYTSAWGRASKRRVNCSHRIVLRHRRASFSLSISSFSNYPPTFIPLQGAAPYGRQQAKHSSKSANTNVNFQPKSLQPSNFLINFALAICPDGGIGRRAGLKHQCRKASRFEPESGYNTNPVSLST